MNPSLYLIAAQAARDEGHYEMMRVWIAFYNSAKRREAMIRDMEESSKATAQQSQPKAA